MGHAFHYRAGRGGRLLELATASWKQTIQQEDTRQRLAGNIIYIYIVTLVEAREGDRPDAWSGRRPPLTGSWP